MASDAQFDTPNLKVRDDGKYPASAHSLRTAVHEWRNGAAWAPPSAPMRRAFPTPVAYDATPGGPNNHYNGLGKMAKTGEIISARMRRTFPTPTTQDAANNGGPSQSDRNTPPFNAIVGGLLNPDWVEWLMGWPIGWTDLERDDVAVADWSTEPVDVPRVTTRKDRRVARLKALGNGQVPQCAALAWRTLLR